MEEVMKIHVDDAGVITDIRRFFTDGDGSAKVAEMWLDPCPFCDGESIMVSSSPYPKWQDFSRITALSIYLECSDCGAKGPNEKLFYPKASIDFILSALVQDTFLAKNWLDEKGRVINRVATLWGLMSIDSTIREQNDEEAQQIQGKKQKEFSNAENK